MINSLSKKTIIRFLHKNGFKYIERNSYANDFCNVVFEDEGISICNNIGVAIYGLDMFGMIGVMTYYGLINRDYKK